MFTSRTKILFLLLMMFALVLTLNSFAYSQDGAGSDLFARNPGLMIGGSIGAGVHDATVDLGFYGTYDDDETGFLLSFLVDLGIQAGPGNVGGQFHFDYITPVDYVDFHTVSFGLLPRYMLDFNINKGIVSVAPFVGWNFQFNLGIYDDDVYYGDETEFRFSTGLAFGVFIQVIEHLHVFNEFDLNFIGVEEDGWIYTNYLIKFGVSYKVVVF